MTTLRQLIRTLQEYVEIEQERREEVENYNVLVSDDAPYGGTNWTWDFYTEIDYDHKVIRIICKCT